VHLAERCNKGMEQQKIYEKHNDKEEEEDVLSIWFCILFFAENRRVENIN